MIKNYLKTAWRSLIRNKSYTAINVTGLAVGIAACLLIFLVVRFETSFDNFHKNKDRIYRLVTISKTPQGISCLAGVPMPTAPELRTDYPKIMAASVLKTDNEISLPETGSKTLKKFDEDGIFFIEPQFFKMFDYQWLLGDKNTALNEPNTVVLTQSAAEKYFGDWRDAVGKTLTYENNVNLKVTGILENIPANTDIDLRVVVSYSTLPYTNFKNALSDAGGIMGTHYCFMVLPDNATASNFNNNLAAFAKKYKTANHANDGLVLQSLNEMHYDSRFGVFTGKTFSKELIKALSLIGLFLLVIACVNFINIATAQAVNRSKEVGIRKVLGSSRKRLVLQFISETFMVTVFAVAIAICLSSLALPFLNQLLDIKLSQAFLSDQAVILFLTGLIFGVTFLSGFYPAIVLSGFNPIAALRNKIAANNSKGISLRRGLVVFQFCLAQVLLIGMLVIVSQMNFFKNYSLGFDKDSVVNLPIPGDSISHARLNALQNELLQQPGIKSVSFSLSSPSDDFYTNNYFKYNNSSKNTDFLTNFEWADASYFKLYNLKFIAGHPYENSDAIHGYVVNETLLKKLGVNDPKDALGKNIIIWNDKTKLAPIVGVVKDFNVSSLREEIPPVLLASWKDAYETINIKLVPGSDHLKQSLTSIERLWNDAFPKDVYQYQFLDKKIENFYKSEDQLSTLYKIFAGIAIFISCLGLYGLVSFMAVQRTKEVGIRKTLGASVSHIVYLFSKEFTVLISVAFAISTPIGWYLMAKWLEAFTYRISVGPGIFIVAIASSIIIAWLTVGYKAISAALANPVTSLKTE